jgi:PAS domain S-box-containing protein
MNSNETSQTEGLKAVVEIDMFRQLQLAEKQNHDLQQELEALKQRFSYVLQATQDAVWDWDLSKNIAWYSEGLYHLFGINTREIDGVKFWKDSIHPDDKERVTNGIQSVIDNGGKNWQDRYRFKKADGSYAWVFDRGYAIHNNEGKPVRMVGSMQDITDEVEAREALRESEEKFRGAFDQLAVGISIATPQGDFLSVNKAYPKIFGYSEEELRTKKISELSHPDELDGDRKIIHQLLQGQEQVVAREKRYIHKSGKIVWGRVFGTVVRDASGSPKYLVGVLEDITGQREVYKALHENEERLRLVIDAAQLGTWDLDARSGKLVWDTRCKAMFGLAPDDHTDYEIFLNGIHPDDRQAAHEANQNALNGIAGGEYDLEYRTIGLRDQKLRWIRAKGRSYKDENGVTIRYAGTVIDVTKRKHRSSVYVSRKNDSVCWRLLFHKLYGRQTRTEMLIICRTNGWPIPVMNRLMKSLVFGS